MSRKKFPLRVPRFAAGIRAQEPRGSSGRSWWAKQWTQSMEAMGLGARLGRGRNYAMSGQVVKMSLQGPLVAASVVGARPDPYDVSIVFRTPEGEARERIVSSIKAEPMLVARLLADELPMEVERIFKREGFDLLPGGKIAPGVYDVTTRCSCPDYANPCKHSSAVLTILGEEIARKPQALLELRGIAMEELCNED